MLRLLLITLALPALAWQPGKIPDKNERKQKLTKKQYEITQENDTERPFKNEYWDNHAEGIYVDVVSGEPLFSSTDKFDSGTGWPSFTKPLVKDNIVEKEDHSLFSRRTEVRSKLADSHLGHVFPDGPAPTGLRYCMNSAALKFIPKDKLKESGYGEYASLFSGETKKAIFAGGCFWCMQPPFDKLKDKGVTAVVVGYTGGHKDKPTYEETSSGGTGHREAVEVAYDPKKISYKELLDVFWLNIDPLDSKGQFCDKGEQYTSAVFYSDDAQKKELERGRDEITKKLKKTPVTAILPAKTFYPAEDYHQGYYIKNPVRYKYYRYNCGRDKRLSQIWGAAASH